MVSPFWICELNIVVNSFAEFGLVCKDYSQVKDYLSGK